MRSKTDQLKKLADKKNFCLIAPMHYSALPANTQIAYVYRNQHGELVPIISAFIREHYLTTSGAPGMIIKCGRTIYSNLYQTMERLYVRTKDIDRLRELMKHPPKTNVELFEALLQRVAKVEGNIDQIVTHIKKSTSTETLAAKKPKIKKSVSLTHDTKPIKTTKTTPKPVVKKPKKSVF